MNVTAPLRTLARSMPQAPAIIAADGRIVTYAALDRGLDGIASRARTLGLRAGRIAGLAIGGPDEALALMLALGLARAGIATANPAPAPPGLGTILTPDAAWRAAAEAASDAAACADQSALLRVFTSSGTTGAIKHVPVSHALMTRRVEANARAAGDGRAVRLVAVGLGIAWGFVAVLRTLWAGGTLVIGGAREAAAYIPRHGVTSLLIAPAGLRLLLEALPPDAGPFATLAQVEIGGSRLPGPLRAAAAARLSPHLCSSFGATEAGNVAFAPFVALDGVPGAVGFIDPLTEVTTADATGAILPAGQEGRLRIRSPLLADGYLRADGSVAPFRDGWFESGDIGTLLADGRLVIAGRDGEIAADAGARIDASAIEDALLTLPEIAEVAAFGLPDAAGRIQVWAAIVPAGPMPPAALAALCRARLPATPPRFIMQMPALPCGANGKVRRDVLIATARSWQEAGSAAPSPPAGESPMP